MSSFIQSGIKNRLLTALPAKSFAVLAPHMKNVTLPLRHVLVEPDKPTESVCFIESGLGSVVTTNGDRRSIEVAHVGREGMSGAHVLLGTDRISDRTFMQVAGDGIEIPTPSLLSAVETDPKMRVIFTRYLRTLEAQVVQTALANAKYSLHARLARWLLMCHDRLDGKDIAVTHEFLSLMLGVRRPGVTNELNTIEGLGAIKATRGHVRILDRPHLERLAGGCYGRPEEEYERLIGFPMKPARE